MSDPKRRTLFDAGWKFALKDAATEGAEVADFDDAAWRDVNLPHDFSIEGTFSEEHPAAFGGGYLPGGIGWYRKTFTLTPEQRGKQVSVEFDGVYKNADVWINGYHLGHRPYGYSSYAYELTPYLNEGENVLAVRADNSEQPDTRWYTGSGIHRHVWLTATEALHVAHWGTYVHLLDARGEPGEELTTIAVQTRVVNQGDDESACTLFTEIVDADGQVVASEESLHPIAVDQEHEFMQRLRVPHAHLWSIEDPYLYTVRSTVREGGRVTDVYETPLGIRTIEFHVDHGFMLNGKRVKINGVCLHHDAGCLGAAVPERVWERRLELLKEMGCNGIRTSHYPPSPELLDMCDRMGFVVMDEAFDEWAQSRYAYGYHDDFDEWAEEDLVAMLHRDRNHPSVVMWSIGNEIPEQTRPEGVEIARWMVDVCHREDPTRPTVSACDLIEAPYAASGPTLQAFMEALDIVGYNYVDRWAERSYKYYSLDRDRFPERKFIGSENRSHGGVRGAYSLETQGGGFRRGPYYSRMIAVEQLWKFTKNHDYVAGDFMWTGIDYLGESRWPAKNSSSGPIDLCGFPKDGFYFYQSQWSDKPMVYAFPHWNWAGHEGDVLPVICYTNCESVELFVNGKSWGVKSYAYAHNGFDRTKSFWDQNFSPPVWPTTADMHLSWDVPYEPGTLRMVGRINGEVVCEREVATAGEPAAIELTVDRETILTDPRDVAHVTVRALDAAGHPVPMADHLITFEVEGEGRIIGVDNGNPTSHEPFQANERKLFNGLALAIVQSTGAAGSIRVTATSPGLQGQSVTVNVTEGTW
jgi:beta-galactosidase